jgi:signal peptidase I
MENTDPTIESPRRAPWWQIIIMGRNPKVTAVRLVVMVLIVVAVFRYVILPIRVTGISMQPTYRDGQKLYINRLSLWRHPPERGDILAIRTSGIHNLFLKRVIALPGEHVRIVRGQVLIDGEPLDEPYVLNRAPWNWPAGKAEEILGADEYLMIGDNRSMRVDEHEFGVANRSKLVGRIMGKGAK